METGVSLSAYSTEAELRFSFRAEYNRQFLVLEQMMMCYLNHVTSLSGMERWDPELPSGPLQANYQAFLMAPMASIFDAFASDERFCRLVPNLQKVTGYESAQGLTRRCDFGNDMIVEQRIVACHQPSLYAYCVTMPNPLGLRRHYSIVTFQPESGGTHLRWQHYFEHDDLVAMLAMLNRMFEHVFTGLCEEFDGHIVG